MSPDTFSGKCFCTCNDSQQGGFSFSIGANQRNFITPFNFGFGMPYDLIIAKTFT